MARSTFKVLFYVNGSKVKNGIVSIMERVIINGTVELFSCKRTIPKDLWDAKGNTANGKSMEARETNLALDNIKARIIKHYQRIRPWSVCNNRYGTQYLSGIERRVWNAARYFRQGKRGVQKTCRKNRVRTTYMARVRARNHVSAFIRSHYKRNDISMSELTPDFIKEFAVFLYNEAGLHNGLIWENCMWLKGVVMRAHFNGHATVVPIVTGERRKANKEQEDGKHSYRKKPMSCICVSMTWWHVSNWSPTMTDTQKRWEIRFTTWHKWPGSTAYHHRIILPWFDTADKWTRSQYTAVKNRTATGRATAWGGKAVGQVGETGSSQDRSESRIRDKGRFSFRWW